MKLDYIGWILALLPTFLLVAYIVVEFIGAMF